MLAARSAVFPGSLMDYAAHLEQWRDAGTLEGTRTVREPAAPGPRLTRGPRRRRPDPAAG